MNEWRVIPKFPDYEVTCDGRVRRCTSCRGSYIGKELRANLSSDGYLILHLRKDGRPHCVGIHHLVAMAFLPPKPTAKHEVAHNDGDPQHNHYTNLRWATKKENMADTLIHGTRARGERNGRVRLTSSQVAEMRNRIESGVITRADAAREYCLTPSYVSQIIAGNYWKHLQEAA